MAFIDDFIAHPRTFMRANIVAVNSTCNEYESGEHNFTLVAANGLQGVAPDGTEMNVYAIRKHEGQGPIIRAFWCKYAKNGHLGVPLPGRSNTKLMFTYAMDGCTLGVGTRTEDGSCLAHHINCAQGGSAAAAWGDDVAAEQQRKLQRLIGRSILTNAEFVEPGDYMNPATRPVVIPGNAKISTNTFGRLSSGNEWKFYTHQWYTVPGDRMRLRFIGSMRAL